MLKRNKLSVKERVDNLLIDDHDAVALRAAGKSNIERHLYDIFFWQEAQELSTVQLKRAWTNAQREDGPIDTDDDLRACGSRGGVIVCESDRFSVIVTVQDPRMNFDRELFISALCKAYKLNHEDVEKLAEQCRQPTKAPLSKRVVEA